MGWSLSGILGAAMVGGGAAAERNFVEERRNEQAMAKAKELAQFNSDLEFDRAQRVQEAKDKRTERETERNLDSNATNMELAKEYATGEAKTKPGSVEFYEAQADFLNRSGRQDLAKDMLNEANRIRTDDTKDQIASARAEAARARREGGGSGGKGSGDDAGKIDIDAALGNIAKIGVSTKDGEAKADPGAYAVANAFYNQAFANTKDEKKALDVTRAMMIRTYEYAQDNSLSLREASKAVVGKIKDVEATRKGEAFNESRKPKKAASITLGKESYLDPLENGAPKFGLPGSEAGTGVTKKRGFLESLHDHIRSE